MRILAIVCCVLLLSGLKSYKVKAQVMLKRQVLSSLGGAARPDSSLYIGYTFGQSPPSGTIFNGNAFIRQGFEQPPQGPECGVLNNFFVEAITTDCGTYYSFEYTGTVLSGLEFEWVFGAHAVPPTSSEMNPGEVIFTRDSMRSMILLNVRTEDGCNTSAIKIIDVLGDGFTSRLMPSKPGCQDTAFNLMVEPINGTEPFSINWSDGGEGLDRVLSEGNFSYTLTDANDCQSEGSIDLRGLNPVMSLEGNVNNASCDTAFLGAMELEVGGGLPPFTYAWSNGFEEKDQRDVYPGTYQVTVTDSRACEISGEFTVDTECLTENDLPNVITPNGDNTNDTWIVPGINFYPENELEIFNRWGSLVYKSAPYRNDWGGTNMEGAPIPMGAYYYVLKLNDAENTIFSGSITIIR